MTEFIQKIATWARASLEVFTPYLSLMGLVCVVLSVGSFILIPGIIRLLPEDYYSPHRKTVSSITGPVSFVLLILKNGAGLILVLAGLAMLVLPGQGLITIVLGVSLMDFPGKRRLEMRIVRQKDVKKSLNWIRKKMGRPDFITD